MEREKLISMVRAVQNGEEDSKAALYDTFYDNLYYYIMKTVKDPELGLDLTQETFIEIFQTINSLKEPAAFVTWSRKIAYHRCTAYFKKRRELLADEEKEGSSVFDTLVEERAEFIPDEALDKEEFKQTIHAMIQSLPEEQRVAIMLRYFDEKSVNEIAEIQGVTEGTVKSRLNYGRKTIKQAVENYEKKTVSNFISLALFQCYFGFSGNTELQMECRSSRKIQRTQPWTPHRQSHLLQLQLRKRVSK